MGWAKNLGIGVLGTALVAGVAGRCSRDEAPQAPADRAFNLFADKENHDRGALQAMVAQIAEGRDSIRSKTGMGFILGETTETLLAKDKECSDKQKKAISKAEGVADEADENEFLKIAGPQKREKTEEGYFEDKQLICLDQANALFYTSEKFPAVGAIVSSDGEIYKVYSTAYFNGTDAQRAKMEYRALHPNVNETITGVIPSEDDASPQGREGRDLIADTAEYLFDDYQDKLRPVLDLSIGAIDARAKYISTEANTYTTNQSKSKIIGTGPFIASTINGEPVYATGQYVIKIDETGRKWQAVPHGETTIWGAAKLWGLTAQFANGTPDYNQVASFCDKEITSSCGGLNADPSEGNWWKCMDKKQGDGCEKYIEYSFNQDPNSKYRLNVVKNY